MIGHDGVMPGTRVSGAPAIDGGTNRVSDGLGVGPGRREGVARWWTPLRIALAVLGVTLVVGYLQKLPCRDTLRWVEGYQLTHVCYTDVLASFTAYGLDVGDRPYLDSAVPYPPLIGAFMKVAAVLASPLPTPSAAYFDVSVILLAMCAVVMVITTAVLAGRQRRWDALMVAAAPVVLLQAFTNWDLFAVALLGVGMVAWKRQSLVWAGVWIGAATATKLWPAVILLALVLLCWRAGRMRQWSTTALVAAVVWAAITVPVIMVAPTGSAAFWRDNLTRGADWDSLWLALGDAVGPVSTTQLNTIVVAATVIVVFAVAALVLRASRRPRVPQVMFVLLALMLVVGKVFSPQDALWLTPLAVLARPRWRAFLVWQVCEVVLTVNRMLVLLGADTPERALPRGWWYVTVGVRDLALLALVAFVVREMIDSRRDVVREDGIDDPAGGVLDGADDAHPRWREPDADEFGQMSDGDDSGNHELARQ